MREVSPRVRYSDFDTQWLRFYANKLHERFQIHRKLWEWCFIAHTHTRHLANLKGVNLKDQWDGALSHCLGFGVGREPLPAYLAGQGCDVLATDAPTGAAWETSGQYSVAVDDLPNVTSLLSRNISFEPLDMNHIPSSLLQGKFDFTWSAGSFEHIGSINQSLDFFTTQMQCLRPGGIAVHTTEYNYASNTDTIEAPDLVLFRHRDLQELEQRLISQGDRLWPLDLAPGTHEADRYVDTYPYDRGKWHLNLRINNHVSTSIALVAVRGG